MIMRIAKLCSLALLSVAALPTLASAQALPPLSVCNSEPKAPACSAVRGDRSEGWKLQSRAEVMAQHGMVTTSQPLAAQAGLRMLMDGGNAIDAAVAAAAVLSVVEPSSVGIASDLFAIVYVAKENKIYVLNASGLAPTGATVEHFNSLGYKWDSKNWGPGSGMPSYGILPVTVPGTVWGWDAVLKRFGKKSFKDVLQPAIDYAENGYPVSERIANDWHLPRALPLRNCCTELDPDSVKTWYINGKPPVAGQIYRNPDLAKTFRLIQTNGKDAFYKGEVARALVAKSTALGGTMTMADRRRAKRWRASAPPVRSTGTSWSRPRSSPMRTSLPTTPTRIFRRCHSTDCCRKPTRQLCAPRSIRVRHLPAGPSPSPTTASATPSCSLPPTARATWSPGSTAISRASDRA